MNISKILKSSKVSLLCILVEAICLRFPILDSFTKHGIERLVPVQNLIKCKMQDNLEFLQWSKRYWDQYYPGGDYDALSRRPRAGAAPAAATPAPASRTAGTGAARRGTTPTTAPAARGKWSGGAGGGAASAALAQENTQLKETVAGLERERDFYFSKLREIEVLLQHAVDADPEIEKDEDGLVRSVQAILYSTEVSSRQVCEKNMDSRLMVAFHRRVLRYRSKPKQAWLRMIKKLFRCGEY